VIVAFIGTGAPRYSASTNFSEPVQSQAQCEAPQYRDIVDDLGTITGWEQVGRCDFDGLVDVYADGRGGDTWACPRCRDDHREDPA